MEYLWRVIGVSGATKKSPGKKFEKVMHEFGQGTLKSSSGEKVTNPKQAQAIAFSEQRKAEGHANPRKGNKRKWPRG